MQRALVLACVLLALVLGATAGPPAGLRRAGKDMIAEDLDSLLAAFDVWMGYTTEPGPQRWLVAGANGRIEKGLDTPEELVAYFRTLPKERTGRGIFLTGDITHLKDPEGSRPKMSEHIKSLLANPEWVAARKKSIADLTALCEREKIDLWVNVFLEGQGLRFSKLTK